MVTEEPLIRGLLRRATTKPQVCMPFGARSVWHRSFEPGQVEDDGRREYAKITWSYEGEAVVQFSEQNAILWPRQIAVNFPDTVHCAKAGSSTWKAYAFTIDGPMMCETLAAFGFKKEGIYDAGDVPEALFEELWSAISDVTPAGEVRAASIAYRLLGLASGTRPKVKRDDMVQSTVTRIDLEWFSPDLNVARIADDLGIHRSVLSRRFAAEMGISPSEYILRFRLQRALSLLKQTRLPINEIAASCGYTDAGYFARIFRERQGMTPGEWRRM